MAPNRSLTHSHTHKDYRTTPESWPGPAPYRSVLACVQNKLGLSIGSSRGLRPRSFTGATGTAGCQWSAPGGLLGRVSHWPHPHTSQLLGLRAGARGRVEQHSSERAAGCTVMDELILATVQTRSEPGPCSLSCRHEVTLQAEITTEQAGSSKQQQQQQQHTDSADRLTKAVFRL